jgi:replicative DNA helicase
VSTPTRLYLAQLVTARSADVRRSAVPSEAFEGGERDIYRAIRAVAADTDVVTMEGVIAELRQVGRLEAAGGYDGVDSLSDHIGANTLDGARVDLVTSATARLLMAASRTSHEAARDGRSRDATEAMQGALRLVQSMDGLSRAVPLKTERQHIAEWAADVTRAQAAPKVQLGALTAAMGVVYPGVLGLVYGESQAGKSFGLQMLERCYLDAGETTLRISCEDSDRILRGRLVAERAGIDALSDDGLTRDDVRRVSQAVANADDSWDRRIVVEHGSSVDAICQTMRTASAECGARIVLIDYVQLIRSAMRGRSEETQEQRLAQVTSDIKSTAKECGQLVWLGSQVTIDKDKAKRAKYVKPTPYDTKGGRVIYDQAEYALALYKTDTGERFAEVQKNKVNGKLPLAKIEVGVGGIFTALRPWTATEPEQTTAPYGGSRYTRGFQDA